MNEPSEHLYPSRPGNWWVVKGKLVEFPEGEYPPEARNDGAETNDAPLIDNENGHEPPPIAALRPSED